MTIAADRLKARYGEPHRAYHDWSHVRALLDLFEAHTARMHDPDAVRLAILYHDAIYDPLSKDNERRSAELCLAEASGPDTTRERAARMIEATAGHRLPPATAQKTDEDEDLALFLDFDLSILAAERHRFEAYDLAIRCEYAVFPPSFYRAARKAVLEGFLARERLFATDDLARAWTERARTNLRTVIGRLAADPSGADEDARYVHALAPAAEGPLEAHRRALAHAALARLAAATPPPAEGPAPEHGLLLTGFSGTGLERVLGPAIDRLGEAATKDAALAALETVDAARRRLALG